MEPPKPRRDPFEVIFGKPQNKHQIQDNDIEVDLVKNLQKLHIGNTPPLSQPKNDNQAFTPNLIELVGRAPLPPQVLEESGLFNAGAFFEMPPNQADQVAKEILSDDDERLRQFSDNNLFEPKTEVRLIDVPEPFYRNDDDGEGPPVIYMKCYQEFDCKITSSSDSESDENAEIEGTYPSEDDDEFHENSDDYDY